MNEYEFGKDIARLSIRLSSLETRMLGTIPKREEVLFEDPPYEPLFVGDEVAFDITQKAAPGACPSSFAVQWKNKKVEVTVCATSADTAAVEANNKRLEAMKKLVRAAAGLNCTGRPGCAAPVTCKEKWSRIRGGQNGNWNCVDSGEGSGCEDEETKWTCTGWFNITTKLECECRK